MSFWARAIRCFEIAALNTVVLSCTASTAVESRASFPVTRYGATADDAAIDSAAIQRAIDACAEAGGGAVVIPKGSFVAGGLRLRDRVRLVLEEGAILHRTNMLAAFVHFAPRDRHPRLPSDRWLIRDVTIENADTVYAYDFERGLWQTGQPAKRLHFQNVKATGMVRPFRVLGDTNRLFDLTLENVVFAMRPDAPKQPVLDLSRFGSLTLRQVTLQNGGEAPLIRARDGNRVVLDGVITVPEGPAPFSMERVKELVSNRGP